MITIWSTRLLGVIGLAAATAAIAAGPAEPRPEPLASSARAAHDTTTESRRPTGHAEHASFGGSAAAISVSEPRAETVETSRPLAAIPAETRSGFDWLAAALGALFATAALGLGAGAVIRYRGSHAGGAA